MIDFGQIAIQDNQSHQNLHHQNLTHRVQTQEMETNHFKLNLNKVGSPRENEAVQPRNPSNYL